MPDGALMRARGSAILFSLCVLACSGRSHRSDTANVDDGGSAPVSRGEPHVSMVGANPYRVFADGLRGVVVAGSNADTAGIVRLSSSGGVEWSLELETGSDYLGLEGAALDDDGSVYVAGAFKGTLAVPGETIESVVNPGTPTDTFDPRGQPSLDLYVLKLDRRGQTVWLKHFGGVADQQALALARAPDGTLGLVAAFTGRVELDGQSYLSSGGASVADLLLVRLERDGSVLAVRTLPVPLPRLATATFDHAGSLYLGGRGADARALAAFGTFPEAGWILKLDASFEPLWLATTDDTDGPDVRSIAVDSEDSIVIATDGWVSRRQFGADVGDASIGLAKLDSYGNLLFARSFGATRLDHGSAVSVLSDDTFAFTGSFYDAIDLGGGELVPLEPYSSGASTFASDTFAARFDPQGGYLGGVVLAAPGSDWAYGMAALPNDALVVTGFSESGFTLGTAPTFGEGTTFVAWLGDTL